MARYDCTEMIRGSGGAEYRNAPDGLYVVRNGIAVAVTAEAACEVNMRMFGYRFGSIPTDEMLDFSRRFIEQIATLTRPADGADA